MIKSDIVLETLKIIIRLSKWELLQNNYRYIYPTINYQGKNQLINNFSILIKDRGEKLKDWKPKLDIALEPN